MGLSASQARFLGLTARKSNIEFQIQQLTHQKLANSALIESEISLFNNGMNIQHLYYDPKGTGSASTDLERLNYQTVTAPVDKGGLAMRVTDSYGRLVVTSLPDPMPEGKTVENYAVEPYATQAQYFEDNLKTGNWFLQKSEGDDWINISIDGASFIYQGVDKSDFNIANAEYEAKVERLEKIDKKFDMQIQSLANEQKAIETEMDSVKKVIDKNIETSFKSFG